MLNNALDTIFDKLFQNKSKQKLNNILDMCCELSTKKNACKIKTLCKR